MDAEENQLTRQIAEELLTLLENDKLQVKHGAISAILQYTKTDEAKMLFKETNLFKQVIKIINIPELTKICLSLLINFSANNEFSDEYPVFVEPILFQLKEWKNLQQEMALLLMLNISKFSDVIDKLIGKDDMKGFFIEVLYGYMENKQKQSKQWVIANIFVNISSTESGRKYLVQEKLYLRFLQFINGSGQALRLAILRILRNVAFQWEDENFITEILKPEHKFIDEIALHIIIMIIRSELSSIKEAEDLGKEYIPIENLKNKVEKIKTSKEKSLNEIEMSVDIILILSNCNFQEKKPQIKKESLKELISLLKFVKVKEETKDQLQALQTFCFW